MGDFSSFEGEEMGRGSRIDGSVGQDTLDGWELGARRWTIHFHV